MAGNTVAAHANDQMIDESSTDLVAYQQLGWLNLTIKVVASFLGDCAGNIQVTTRCTAVWIIREHDSDVAKATCMFSFARQIVKKKKSQTWIPQDIAEELELDHNGVYFVQSADGVWQPKYGDLSKIEVQSGAPLWQVRAGKPGWFEVDEGRLAPAGEANSATDKDLVQQRKCCQCDQRFHWRTMKMSWETVYTCDTARRNAGTIAEYEDVKCGRQYRRKWHTCLPCYAQERVMSEQEAKKILMQNRSSKMLARAATYQHVKKYILSTEDGTAETSDAARLMASSAESSLLEIAPARHPSANGKKQVAPGLQADPRSNKSKKAMRRKLIRVQIETMAQTVGSVNNQIQVKNEDENQAGLEVEEAAKKSAPDGDERGTIQQLANYAALSYDLRNSCSAQ